MSEQYLRTESDVPPRVASAVSPVRQSSEPPRWSEDDLRGADDFLGHLRNARESAIAELIGLEWYRLGPIDEEDELEGVPIGFRGVVIRTFSGGIPRRARGTAATSTNQRGRSVQ